MADTTDILRRMRRDAQVQTQTPAPGTIGAPPSGSSAPGLDPSRYPPVPALYDGGPLVNAALYGVPASQLPWAAPAPDLTTADIADVARTRQQPWDGSLGGLLHGLRDAIPANPHTPLSALNMARGGLDTMGNWAAMDPTMIGWGDMLAPTGQAGLVTTFMRPSPNVAGMFIGPLAASPHRRTIERARNAMIDDGLPPAEAAKRYGVQYDPLADAFGVYADTSGWRVRPEAFGSGSIYAGPLSQVLDAPGLHGMPGLYDLYPGMSQASAVVRLRPSPTSPEGLAIPFPRGGLSSVEATAHDPEMLLDILRHEVAGHGVDFAELRRQRLTAMSKGLPYFQTPVEISARRAHLAPHYNDALLSGALPWSAIDVWRHPTQPLFDQWLAAAAPPGARR
jgi:hypothetical protein